MLDAINTGFEKIIIGAERLGNMTPAAAWAFITLLLTVEKVYDRWQAKKSADEALKVRLEQAKADNVIGLGLQRMADEIRFKLTKKEDRESD